MGDRIDRIRSLKRDLEEFGRVPREGFRANRERQYAVPHAMQNAIEGCLEIASHIVAADKAATLALFDVSGRQLAARRVDGMGPGWHTVTLDGRSNLPAGLYVIRLTQDGHGLTTRAALVP